jgi:hypothetical protein
MLCGVGFRPKIWSLPVAKQSSDPTFMGCRKWFASRRTIHDRAKRWDEGFPN